MSLSSVTRILEKETCPPILVPMIRDLGLAVFQERSASITEQEETLPCVTRWRYRLALLLS